MYGILFDANLCVGCGACQEACKAKNELPESQGAVLSATDYTVLEEYPQETYLRRMCMHCLDPSCASACPVGALHKTQAGPVVYDFEKCIGCRYCMVACPFSVPRYEWASRTPRVRKCQMCPDRIAKGLPTACAEACPMEATLFGDREKLTRLAWGRIASDPDNYARRVYGSEVAGGTSVLIIGPQQIMEAFDPRIPMESLPDKTWVVLSQIPTSVGMAGVALLGISWVIRRRIALAAEKAAESGAGETMAMQTQKESKGDLT